MPIVGGLDIHRKQITFDYLGTETGQVCRGQISPADRVHLRAWLTRFAGRETCIAEEVIQMTFDLDGPVEIPRAVAG